MDVDSISVGKVDAPEKALWVGLLGYDQDEIGNQYCCSFPFDKAIDPFGDVILAYEMNGEPIPRYNVVQLSILSIIHLDLNSFPKTGPMGSP